MKNISHNITILKKHDKYKHSSTTPTITITIIATITKFTKDFHH